MYIHVCMCTCMHSLRLKKLCIYVCGCMDVHAVHVYTDLPECICSNAVLMERSQSSNVVPSDMEMAGGSDVGRLHVCMYCMYVLICECVRMCW
jgi:hypothetical protein